MTDTKKYCCLTVVLIVALRLSIGWQFLYEGLWKFKALGTSAPWSAEGYLKNAQGPFRNYFRGMTGDPDDLNWLDRDKVAAKWDDWAARFTNHFGLDDAQKKELDRLLNGVSDFRVELAALPEGVTIPKDVAKAVKYDAKAKRLICDGKLHMLASEREALLALAKIDESASAETQKTVKAFHDAVTSLYKRASDAKAISIKERLGATLVGNPEVAGRVYPQYKDTIDERRLGDIDLYKANLERYEANLAKANKQSAMQFPREHLQKQWSELQQLKSKVVGPVKSLESELKIAAQKLLSTEQLARGPVKLAATPVDRINKQTMWGLTILGIMLLVGCGTRIAAVAGAFMMVMFYLPLPPWPGVPEAPGPEHSLFINKNLIEAIALLAIASLPTGQWFGLDRLCSKFCCRKKSGCCSPTAGAACATAPSPTTK